MDGLVTHLAKHLSFVFCMHDGATLLVCDACAGIVKGRREIKTTNVDEFLSVREREFVANGGHDRLLACYEICAVIWNIIIKGLLPRLLEKERAENCTTLEEYMLPLGREESAEVELLPPKIEDIVAVVVVVAAPAAAVTF